MPDHYIEITLPRKPVENADTTVAVWSGGAKLGELRLSKGSLDWVPANSPKPRRISWENAALLFENHQVALKALRAKK